MHLHCRIDAPIQSLPNRYVPERRRRTIVGLASREVYRALEELSLCALHSRHTHTTADAVILFCDIILLFISVSNIHQSG